jgi:hypothetical protein
LMRIINKRVRECEYAIHCAHSRVDGNAQIAND